MYLPDGGQVALDTTGLEGEASLAWLDVLTSRWSDPRAIPAGASVSLEAPGPGHWIALVTGIGVEGLPR